MCAVAAGEGMDDRMVWVGPMGEKYDYPTGLPAQPNGGCDKR